MSAGLTGRGRQDEEVAMTWDVYVSGDDRSWETGDGVAGADVSLGSETDVRRQVDDVWPGATWDDRTGWVEREDVVAEVVLAAGDPVGSLTVQVRGGSNPVQAVLDLCRRSGWTPLDFSTGRVLTVQENGYGRWLELQEGAGQPPEPEKPAPSPGRRRWGWRR